VQPGIEELAAAILRELATEPAPMSLPRLGKRLGQGASVLMRCLALMGDVPVAGMPGPGWVSLQHQDGRWMVALTGSGREQARGL
jgi:FdhD protein